MTWGTFDKESVTDKIQALYEAAVLEATGKDDESQVARLRLLLEQIMSLTGLGPPSSSGATSETAGGPTGVSLGEAQPSQGDHGRSKRVPPRWLAPTAKWAAAPAGKTAPRRSSPSEPQDKRRRRLADPPPELGHSANLRVFPRPRSLQPSDTAAGGGKDAPAGDEAIEGFWQSALFLEAGARSDSTCLRSVAMVVGLTSTGMLRSTSREDGLPRGAVAHLKRSIRSDIESQQKQICRLLPGRCHCHCY